MPQTRRAGALAAIAAFHDQPLGHFIDGQPVAGDGKPFDVMDPSTGEILGQTRDATAAEVDHAVDAARRAFPGWAATQGDKRKAILHKIADLIEARADEIAAVECLDAGQAWRFHVQGGGARR